MADSLHPFPNVSVIVLTYNGSRYMKPLIESLMNQSYPGDRFEIVVVDNASSDNTRELIKDNYPFVKVVALKRNLGFAAGNNQGFLHASHDVLVFLNQDTICRSDFLVSLVAAMVADQSIAACNPNIIPSEQNDIRKFGNDGSKNPLFLCDLSPFGYGKNLRKNATARYYTKLLSGCAFIIRRETIAELGGLFDDQLWMYAEDTDLSLRLHNLGKKICVIPQAVVYHLHNRSMTIGKDRLSMAAAAIQNRVLAFYKNMSGSEFLLFLPFLILGGVFKIFEFPFSAGRKAIYFLPFGFFSLGCMIVAFSKLPRFAVQRRDIMKQRRIPDFDLLKLILR